MKRKLLIIGAVLVVGMLAFVYVMPASGVKGNKPNAEVTITITDLTTGAKAAAVVTVGEPSGLSLVKQKVDFKPLATYSQTQALSIYFSHKYAIMAQVAFKYTGTNIGSYWSAQAMFDATPSYSNFVMITANQFTTLDGKYLTNDLCRLTITKTTGLTSPMTIGMDSTMAWVYQAAIGNVGWKTAAPSTTSWDYLTGGHIGGATINCKVIVRGSSPEGQSTSAEVTAQLSFLTTFLTETGTIQLSVDSMSAGVS